jgi:hypothetical protein
MNVNGISPVAAITGQSAAARGSVPNQRSSEDAARPQTDQAASQPVVLHFPWLSRVTMQLEKASNQTSPYGATVPLGENVNKKV